MSCGGTLSVAFGMLGDCVALELGCLLLTEGQPTQPPLADELPIRFDADTGSLWIWRCNAVDDAGTWIELEHKTLCQADILDPSEIDDICNKLHIPVTFSDSGNCCGEDCEERRVTILDFAQQIKDCLDLKRVCELSFISDVAVNGAELVQVAACVDGVEGLITPFSLCNLSPMSQGQVEAATSVLLGACVDGTNRLIPVPPAPTPFTVCAVPAFEQDPIVASTSMSVLACIGGVQTRVNKSTYFAQPVCTLPALDPSSVETATLIQLAACVDGVNVRIPYNEPTDLCGAIEYQNNFIHGEAFGPPKVLVCVDDGTTRQILKTPWVRPNNLLPSADQTTADAATLVEVPVILDGVNHKVTLTVLKALLAALP